MKYIIKLHDSIIAEAYNLETDEGMGVKTGKYKPKKAYNNIEQIIKQYTDMVYKLNVEEIETHPEFQRIIKEIDNFNLTAYDESNKRLICSKIDLRDYSDSLGDEGYEIIIYP